METGLRHSPVVTGHSDKTELRSDQAVSLWRDPGLGMDIDMGTGLLTTA